MVGLIFEESVMMGLFKEGEGTVVDSFEISDMVSKRTGIEREE